MMSGETINITKTSKPIIKEIHETSIGVNGKFENPKAQEFFNKHSKEMDQNANKKRAPFLWGTLILLVLAFVITFSEIRSITPNFNSISMIFAELCLSIAIFLFAISLGFVGQFKIIQRPSSIEKSSKVIFDKNQFEKNYSALSQIRGGWIVGIIGLLIFVVPFMTTFFIPLELTPTINTILHMITIISACVATIIALASFRLVFQ